MDKSLFHTIKTIFTYKKVQYSVYSAKWAALLLRAIPSKQPLDGQELSDLTFELVVYQL